MKTLSEEVIAKILNLSTKYDMDSTVNQFAFNERVEYIKKHLENG